VAIPDPLTPATEPGGVGAFRPAAMCYGPGHVIRFGNAAFAAAFGRDCVGLPAREGLVALPARAFLLLDAVLTRGRPFSRWIRLRDGEWRMTAVPRIDIGTGETYGVSFHLRSRHDLALRTRAAGGHREAGAAGEPGNSDGRPSHLELGGGLPES
jgi:hypothetical protein